VKFFYFYEDFLTEARTMASNKFTWVAENMGDWLYDELYKSPEIIKGLPNIDQFSTYVGSTIKKTPTTNDLVENLWLMDTFLNRLDQKDSANFIKSVLKTFPKILGKISRYGKPESSGKRGRPMGSKNKPKTKFVDDLDVTVTKPTTEPSPEVEIPKTAKKVGRPKIYNDDFTNIERSKYRREGPAMITSLEAKVQSLDNELDVIVQRIKKIMIDIDKRKKFFGLS